MGLCKCPKRKVTNQFCFEHRVNVCEHCMVTNHPKCIVQSYLQWLQDSDCDPRCTLCSGNLSNGDCARLTCYHVFHWSCLDSYARNLPSTTAPAGYECPTCKWGIFPKANLVSVVADELKQKLSGVNWGRAGLALPLLSEDREVKPSIERKTSMVESEDSAMYQNHSGASTVATSRVNSNASSMISNSNLNNVHATNSQKSGPPYSVVNIESSSLGGSNSQAARKIFEAYDDPKSVPFDHDDNKYQRKSPIEWFLRWWKLITTPPARRRAPAGSIYKRYALAIFVGILVFLGIVMLFSWLGKMATDGDPQFDLHSNKNIKIQHDAPY